MLGGIRRRLTFANVVSVIALFCALGGGAYAAVKLPNNSVGTKQLRNRAVSNAKLGSNAVTGAKVKNGSLTGADIKLSSLSKVPSAASADNAAHATNADNTAHATNADHAANADHATNADNIAAPEPVHLVGAPGQPDFLSGSSNVPDSTSPTPVKFEKAGFYKDREGTVHLTGFITTGTNGLLFALPQGYRPAPGTALAAAGYCDNCSEPVSGGGGGSVDSFATTIAIVGAGGVAGLPDGAVDASRAPAGSDISLDGITFRATD